MIAIANVIPKLQTAKDVVRQISKKSRFRKPFDSQHVKASESLVASTRQRFYHNFSSLWAKLSWEISLLVICEIWGVFVNTLTLDDKYPPRNCENLRLPIQMQFYKKRKTLYLGNYRLSKMWLDNYLKSSVSEYPPRVNMLKSPKHLWNLHGNIFIMIIAHSGQNWLKKCLYKWHMKSWWCFLAHWLSKTSIVFEIVRICRSQFK